MIARAAASLRALTSDRRAIAVLAAAMPALAALAPNAIAIVLPAAALGTLLRGGPILRPALGARSVWSVAAVFLGLMIWSALSIIWSIDPDESAARLAKIAAIGACGLLVLAAATQLTAEQRAAWALGLLAGTVLLLAQIGEELLSGGAIIASVHWVGGDAPAYRMIFLQTGANLLAILIWPTAAVAWRRFMPALAVALVGTAGALIVLVGAAAAAAAFVAGGLVFGAARLAPRATLMIVGGLVAAGFVLAPLVSTVVTVGPWMKSLPDPVVISVYHRAKIWSFTAERIKERPLLGWGLDSARSIPGGDEKVDINKELDYRQPEGVPPKYTIAAVKLPLHPHNGILQLWLELGAVGAALGLGMVVIATVAIGRGARDPASKSAQVATFLAALVVAGLSYGLWQSWWLSALWLIAAAVVGLPSGRTEPAVDTV